MSLQHQASTGVEPMVIDHDDDDDDDDDDERKT